VRPLLMMVTDRHRAGDGTASSSEIDALVSAAGRAARAGVTMIQVRERGLDDRTLLGVTARVQRAVEGTAAKVLVNDRADVALAAKADGVHLPAAAAAAARVRSIAPAGFTIGRSVHSEAEAVAAERSGGCDYLIFGAIFETVSKPPGHAVAGVDALARVCAAVSLPVLAIGGIAAGRAVEIARAGAAGIAGIGLFARGSDGEIRSRVRIVEDAFGAHD
jgi:thiamine-phosphate pyrophosphorylase